MRANNATNFHERFGFLAANATFPEIAVAHLPRLNLTEMTVSAESSLNPFPSLAAESDFWTSTK
jgi:hypothetical protein